MNKQSVNVRSGAFLFKQLLVESLLFFQQQKIETVWYEYGEIVNASEISMGTDKIYDVCY